MRLGEGFTIRRWTIYSIFPNNIYLMDFMIGPRISIISFILWVIHYNLAIILGCASVSLKIETCNSSNGI